MWPGSTQEVKALGAMRSSSRSILKREVLATDEFDMGRFLVSRESQMRLASRQPDAVVHCKATCMPSGSDCEETKKYTALQAIAHENDHGSCPCGVDDSPHTARDMSPEFNGQSFREVDLEPITCKGIKVVGHWRFNDRWSDVNCDERDNSFTRKQREPEYCG